MLMAHSLQKRPLQAKLLSPKTPARRSAAERSEARREAVGFELQPEYPSMESSPPRCLHSKSFLSFSLHPATKFPEYPFIHSLCLRDCVAETQAMNKRIFWE